VDESEGEVGGSGSVPITIHRSTCVFARSKGGQCHQMCSHQGSQSEPVQEETREITSEVHQQGATRHCRSPGAFPPIGACIKHGITQSSERQGRKRDGGTTIIITITVVIAMVIIMIINKNIISTGIGVNGIWWYKQCNMTVADADVVEHAHAATAVRCGARSNSVLRIIGQAHTSSPTFIQSVHEGTGLSCS
jgi:hypothetical protein